MPTDDLMPLEDELLEPQPRKTRSGGLLAGLAILLALGAAALSGWLWWQARDTDGAADMALQARLDSLQQRQNRQAQDLAALQSRLDESSESAVDAQALESGLAEQRARSRSLEQELEAQASHARNLQQAIEAMQARLMAVESGLAAQAPAAADAPARLELAGVDFLLRFAPQRLTLFHDIRTADQALALADAQLEAMDNPLHIGLRQRIADARQALAETTLPNPVEISARLDAVQGRLAQLSFGERGDEAAVPDGPVTEAGGDEPGWWARLRASLASLVTVRRVADDTAARLTLDDKDMLRQGLWMQIEAARLALMRHDQPAWNDALSRASAVLERWFDPSSTTYRAVHGELEALAGLTIDPDLPDISGPWAQLQVIRQARAAPSAANEPE